MMFFLTATHDVFIVKDRVKNNEWLIDCWWGNELGSKFYYSLNSLHYDEVEWYETFRDKKISTDFSQLASAYQRKFIKALTNLDEY